MYLVGTSVWIDYMRDIENEVTEQFDEIQERGRPFGITALIYQEVLQGAASPQKFDYLVDFMNAQYFYHPKHSIRSYKEIYREAQRLPEPLAQEVLDFIGYLELKHGFRDANIQDLKHAQSAAMSHFWDNAEDEVWNEV